MLGDRVSLVQGEAVLGIDAVVLAHDAVTLDLRHHRGRRHRVGDGVTADHRQAGERQPGDRDRVDHGTVGRRAQREQRFHHRGPRRAQDVALVDLGRRDDPDRVAQRGPAELCGDRLAGRRVELLAVVHTRHQATGIDDHRGRHHRSRQTAAPHFVDPGDAPESALSQLVLQTREQVQPEGFGEQGLHAALRNLRSRCPPTPTGPGAAR